MRKAAFDDALRVSAENRLARLFFPPVGNAPPLIRGREPAQRLDELNGVGPVPAACRYAEIEGVEGNAHSDIVPQCNEHDKIILRRS